MKKTEHDTALLDVALDLTRALSTKRRFDRLLARLEDAVPYDAAALLLCRDRVLVPTAVVGLRRDFLGRRLIPAEHPRLEEILGASEPVRFADDDPRPDPYDGMLAFDDAGDLHVHSCMGARLEVDGETLGVLTADAARPGAFGDEEFARFRAFAALAAAAIRTGRLIDELEARAEQGEQIARDLNRQALGDAGELIGTSEAMRRLREELAIVAGSDLAVLITGETGTGKELVARTVHARSRRSSRPLVYVNCAALPESIAESELFGHKKGAFTGAVADRKGKFELADGGTLFLDEIGELAPSIQPKLLRALQFGEIQRVGSDKLQHVDVRIIAATNRDLAHEVEEGRFRQDLLHRLSVYPVHVPPLRERPRDVEVLAGYILERLRSKLGTPPLRLSFDARSMLQRYPWPGNVRELEHVLMRAALRAHDDPGAELVIFEPAALDIPSLERDPAVDHARDVADTALTEEDPVSLSEATDVFQRRMIERAVAAADGNWSAAARALEMDRSNLHRLAKRLGLK